MFVKGMYGLGDNIYQRAFVREIREPVFLQTAWPQLYCDLPNVRPVKGVTRLRTQYKNLLAQDQAIWHPAPRGVVRRIRYDFSGHSLSGGTILGAMAARFGVMPRIFNLPAFPKPAMDAPYAVVRPVTVREEWKNTARNPSPKYISQATDILRASGIKVVSVADLAFGQEWAEGDLPASDVAYHQGELSLEKMLGLIQGASVVVGGVGWIVPATIAAGVPLIGILGGQARHNDPSRIVGEPMDLSQVRWIRPDNYCQCKNMQHNCDKTITGFDLKFETALRELCPNQLVLAS